MFDLLTLLKNSLATVVKATKIVRKVMHSGEFGEVSKSDGTPVTIADRAVQYIIESETRAVFPNIFIVGEEGKITKESILPSLLEDSDTFGFPTSVFDQAELLVRTSFVDPSLSIGLREEDLTMYIDPIDATWSFVHGDHKEVSVLCGVCNKAGVPLFGIVCFPFRGDDLDKCLFYGGRAIGVSPSVLKERRFNGEREDIFKNDRLLRPLLCSSSGYYYRPHEDPLMISLSEHFETKIIKLGGAGAKMHSIFSLQSDIYFYPWSTTNFWDTCAGQAIVEGAGGIVTDKFGKVIVYPRGIVPQNKDGLIGFTKCEIYETLKKLHIFPKKK
ncbi:Inositol monophosphatase-like protein [Aduncisulcus paluster]|uniref:3'(2'),5'-bisphosphate nucleotidase 1 n=1 Tax=Aduncisulcus paluster TaxID=2918883 RepID=A0ABQ5JW62_9EUKA|nr:Inositol monophosphatase-like protein [Aduncisulcus paluster]